MSIYASTTYFGDGSQINDALQDLKKIGIRKIELGSNHKKSKEKINLEKSNEFIIHNYFPPQEEDFILNIASSSPMIRNRSIDFIKNTIKWGSKKGIGYYTIHPGFLAEPVAQLGQRGKNRNFDLKFSRQRRKDRKKVIEEAMKVIKNLYQFSNNKIQLLIENQGSKTSKNVTIVDSIEELQILNKFVGPHLKFNFNLAHATLSGIDLEKKEVLRFIFKHSLFFEISEIKGMYDSHLAVFPKRGIIGNLLSIHKTSFKKRNLILEFRNTKTEELKASFDAVSKLYGL